MTNKELNCSGKKSNDERLDASFWNRHWQNRQTGWDIGRASPPIKQYMKQYGNKHAAIFIPGCGNAYEAAYLANQGFTNITLLDIAPKAVSILKEKFKKVSQINIFCEDFFHHQKKYDLILEQTFFCALMPQKRQEYVRKMASLLNEDGKLVGVLFNKEFDRSGPPFGGIKSEYKALFEPYLHIDTMEPCYNSISSRAGSELFINLRRK